MGAGSTVMQITIDWAAMPQNCALPADRACNIGEIRIRHALLPPTLGRSGPALLATYPENLSKSVEGGSGFLLTEKGCIHSLPKARFQAQLPGYLTEKPSPLEFTAKSVYFCVRYLWTADQTVANVELEKLFRYHPRSWAWRLLLSSDGRPGWWGHG